MKILGLETSCDETSAAIVEDGRKIITNVIASSQKLHQKTGGIIPEVAAREQVKCIIPVLEEAIKESRNQAVKLPSYEAIKQSSELTIKQNSIAQSFDSSIAYIDAIAVTIGPGLIGSLLVGVEAAKTISFLSGKPVIPVNHILAHIYANWLGKNDRIPQFPAIALVISGGHTELFFMKDHNRIKWIGGTLDDAAGECFDKTARLLGLGYPGGPAIAAEAEEFRIHNSACLPARQEFRIKLPRPMINSNNLNFSFSGLKTAVLKEINKLKTMKQPARIATPASNPATAAVWQSVAGGWNNETIIQLAHEIQESITDVLVDKTLKAAQKYHVKSVLVGGGVAANKRLTEKFNQQLTTTNLQLFIPPPSLCTDNAAYIASFAFFHNHPVPWQEIQAKPDLEVEV